MREGILSLDCALKTGWCYDPGPGKKLEYGSFQVSNYHYGEGEVLLQFAQNFNDLLKLFNPKYMYIEAPFIGNYKTKRDAVTQNINVAKILLRATGIAHMYGASKGLASDNIKEVNNRSVKVFMCGTANIKKDDMIFACETKGYSPKCDNEADAIGIAHFAHSKVFKKELEFIK